MNTIATSTNGSLDNINAFRQGILYKRRDVFRRIWRPRWFVLQRDVLTYHLLSTDIPHYSSHNGDGTENVQYDQVVRGTFYLRGCKVEANDRLSRESENLFVFSITPPLDSNMESGPCFLATTTPESRADWIQALSSVCESTNGGDGDVVASSSLRRQQDTSDDGGSVANIESGSSIGPSLVSPEEPSSVSLSLPPWRDLDPTHSVLKGVPRRVADRIQTALSTYVPLCDVERGWKLFLEKDSVSAFERSYNGFHMLKTVATIPFSARRIFQLLVDHRRRPDFEPNVRTTKRVKRYSPHTFLDTYSYRQVWPTSAREFGVVVHWRVLCRGLIDEDDNTTATTTDRAICLMGFSDSVVDIVEPVTDQHVRADLKISLYIIQPLSANVSRVTRILSYDLCGNMPKSLTSAVMQQQATLSLLITQHLKETAANTSPLMEENDEAITNEAVVKRVIDKFSNERAQAPDSRGRRPKTAERGESLMLTEDTKISNKLVEPVEEELPLVLTALLLVTPLVLWSFAHWMNLPGKETYFAIAAILAVRAVVLSKLGERIEGTPSSPRRVGTVTCRFSVDLKGVLRFIASRKEEQQEGHTESAPAEISITHIVIGAIAMAIEETESLKCKRVFLPLLGIDGYYMPRGGGVDVSLLVPSTHEGKPDDIYTLKKLGSASIQSIADRIMEEQDRMHDQGKGGTVSDMLGRVTDVLTVTGLLERQILGSCLVIASPDDSDHAAVDIDASPVVESGVNVVVVVGGVRLVRDAPNRQSASVKAPPKATLSMAITIDCPVSNVATSRKFAERVQQLVQFPEMCEN